MGKSPPRLVAAGFSFMKGVARHFMHDRRAWLPGAKI